MRARVRAVVLGRAAVPHRYSGNGNCPLSNLMPNALLFEKSTGLMK